MDYLRQVLALNIRRKIKPMSTNAYALYHIILAYSNEVYFAEAFTASNAVLAGETGLSLSAFHRARNELVQMGYIEYRNGAGNQSGKYTVFDLTVDSDTQTERKADAKCNANATQTERKAEAIRDANDTQSEHSTIYNKPNLTRPDLTRESGARARKSSIGFVPPTAEEVRAYCEERRNKVDPVRFVDFYASKGWYVGKNKMRDWKAAVRTWEKREQSVPPDRPENPWEGCSFGVTV